MSESLPEGLYESLVTESLQNHLATHPQLRPIFGALDDAESPDVLARHVADVVRARLADAKREDRVALVNELLVHLDSTSENVAGTGEQLLALTADRLGAAPLPRPATPLSDAALLTNAKDEPVLGSELRSELASANSVDLLCAFIRWHGLRVLEEPLAELKRRGIRIRVLTTTYVGATERRALDELVRRFGAEVKVNYETQSTRLHAKAWLLRRKTGFDTAYVGSSNLSRSALVDGLEWNVRLSAIATPALIRKFEATFDSYWLDDAFVSYDPDRDGDRLDDALRIAGGGGRTDNGAISLAGLEVTARPHQLAILEALASERARDRHRNLVVAATGTGKTIVAALDYRDLREAAKRDLNLLFVAHRKEILEQSRRAYREVLADGAFGEMYADGMRPERWRHVFASVQALGAYGVGRIDPAQFDVVVIDEFHHARATSYAALLDRLQPQELLGLTATPERGDGFDVRDLFGGRAAYELRLWDALEQDLLVPFHYFGVADDVDLSGLEWKRGSYDIEGLDRVYTGNDARTAKVLRELQDKVTDVRDMRAIGFCVSVRHAEYMAAKFNAANIPSLAVSGDSTRDERSGALSRLRSLEVNCLFAADLYNEGLDVPQVDTILMLRPTASATIFLQQLGRGLRRARGKAVLTVLDFIGNQRKEFRFDQRYRSLTGTSRRRLEREIEQGFPYLPSGSQIVLDRVAQRIVLDNVRGQLRLSAKDLAREVRSVGEATLADFLTESGLDLPDIYGRKQTWTQLRRAAHLPTPPAGPEEDVLLRRVRSVLHVDDAERAAAYRHLLAADGPVYGDLSDREKRLARMLIFAVWPPRMPLDSYDAALITLREHPAVTAEMTQLVALTEDRARHVVKSLGEGLQHLPLASHARYRREEILAGFDYATLERKPSSHMTGVAWAEETRTDLLLVTLHKTEAHFSPNTMYRDFALAADQFHWESQNSTAADVPTGRRYREHAELGSHVVLFVRDAQEDDFGTGAPYTCLGQVDYVEHTGEKPMAITWRLRRAMPADLYVRASAVAR
ncbi:DUF3427 domain-containing protein [Mumia zhuanghuii]|uniref:DUF3427 domain-containing protein n=1 Tax=Mumia zhuanghuii TaxID=2585211 RepID=A0A5C4N1P2_9ACTN|nr:DEAD/DEAH box helicase [Mumia zhuanghuii]TNC52584.1 DUF3427 domain-containing protein [Mumia zhuanghuii]TNC52682.1 DUF3427 domain-containing protein [Mumia zhuanghuii]